MKVGSHAFDRLAWLEGPPAYLSAVFDAGTREVVGVAIEDSNLRLRGGILTMAVKRSRGGWPDPDDVHGTLDRSLDLAQRLVLPASDLVTRLVRRAEEEGVPAVRDVVLRRLFEEAPADERTIEAARRWLDRLNDGPILWLAAGIADNDRGRAILAQLASDPTGDALTRVEALVQLGDAAGATQLIVLFERRKEDEVRVAAAEALGSLGALAMVERLHAAVGTDTSPRVFQATTDAIAAIQARHGGAGGGLALASEQDEGVRLAFASDPPPGALSKEGR